MSAKSIYFVFAFVMLAVALMGSNGLLGNGEYRVIASALSDERGIGDYTLTVRVVKDGK